jgi:DNA primase
VKIPQDIIDRVREATDIVSLVGESVRLAKAGRSFKGLCPFHTEKSPSFHVNPERQIYHCFGCGAGGNAITFLIEHGKMTFPEAVRHLADRAGIVIPAGSDEGADTELSRIHEALAFAAEFFEERLKHPYAGEPARDYLAARGFDAQVIEEFALGFAPDGWSNLFDVAKTRFTQDILVRAGLVVQKETGGAYDRFRNRLMVPITSSTGRVIGFGGRTLGDDPAKYINSPESPVYQKSQVLFGLPLAREQMRRSETAILVEGYFDLMRVHAAGLTNVVAVSGTAFTPQQAALLKRHVNHVRLVFDGDAAGLNAAWKAAGLCLEAGLDPAFVVLPEGDDPDSFLRREGVEPFRAALEAGEDVVEFTRERLLPKSGKEDAIRRFVELVRGVPDPIRRRLLVQSAAERLRFDEAVLVQVVEGGPRTTARPEAPLDRPAPAAELPVAEKTLLAILLDQPRLLPELGGLEPEDFEDERARVILTQLSALPESTEPRHRMIEWAQGTPILRVISQLLDEPTHGGLMAALDCARALRRRRLKTEIGELRKELAAAERNRESEQVRDLLERIKELSNQTRTLTTGA